MPGDTRTHLMNAALLDACGTAPPGSLSVTPRRENVTCEACLALPVPPDGPVASPPDEPPARKLTAKQQQALDHLLANPHADPDDLIDAAGVQGGADNRAVFLLRFLRAAKIRLVPPAPELTRLVALGHGEYLPNAAVVGLRVETVWDPYLNDVQADLTVDEDKARTLLLERNPGLDASALPDCDLTWSPVDRWAGPFEAWEAAFEDLARQVGQAPGGDDDTFDYWPSGARLLLQVADVLGPFYTATAERLIRRVVAEIEPDFQPEILGKTGLLPEEVAVATGTAEAVAAALTGLDAEAVPDA